MNNTVYKNTSIVTGLSVVERALGFLYRIVLSRLIGAEGLGLYQVAFSLYTLFYTLGTGGLPITVSRMIAKNRAENNPHGEKTVLAAGICLALLLSLPVCLLLWVLGNNLGFLFSDLRSLKIFRILLIGLSFSAFYAVIRGYFWGNKQFLTASLLESSEEIIVVLAGIVLLRGITSPTLGAERAAWAIALSDVAMAIISVVCFFVVGGQLSKPEKMLKPLFNASMPITLVRASTSLVNSAVAVLLPAALIACGYSEAESLRLFGIVSGMVIPFLFAPATLIGSLALVLVPELSEDYYKGNFKRLRTNVQRGLRFSLLIACTFLPFFSVLGKDLGSLAFSNAVAGEMIAKSCLILLPMCLTMISTSMLNSLGFEKQTFLFFFFGAATLLLCILFLPAVCGAYAYIVGLGASYTVTAVANLLFLQKKCPFLIKQGGHVRVQTLFSCLLLILPVSLLGQFFLVIFKNFFGEILSVLFTGVLMAVVTLLLYFIARILPWEKAKGLFHRRKS